MSSITNCPACCVTKYTKMNVENICFPCKVKLAPEIWNKDPRISSLAREIVVTTPGLGAYVCPPGGVMSNL